MHDILMDCIVRRTENLAMRITRREFLAQAAGAALLLPACSERNNPARPTDGGAPPPDDAAPSTPPDLLPTPQCAETEDNILGPYYRAGAPFRTVLGPASEGEPLVVAGSVRATGTACAALDGALLDVWQADASAVYDTTSPDYRWRGKMNSDGAGQYQFQSVLPGRYLNGDTYRPRHIHFQVSHAGYTQLTTQLYFEGDPYNPVDPFIRSSLIKPLRQVNGVWQVEFDIVLTPA
jgi:catechol 1,2-dioxygenase